MADFWIAQSVPGMFTPRYVLDLPDAEHIHVTRRPDGSIASAVPMVQVVAPDRTVTWGDAPWLAAAEQGDER